MPSRSPSYPEPSRSPSCPPQDSLGGNAKTSLLVAACDALEHVDETLQSLQVGGWAVLGRLNVGEGVCCMPARMLQGLQLRRVAERG